MAAPAAHPRDSRRRALAALALAALAAWPRTAVSGEKRDPGCAVFFDNDALAAGTHDHDYTGGLALTLAGRRVRDWPLSLDPALGRLDRLAGLDRPDAGRWHALQFALLAFTPSDLRAEAPVAGDRPYASIVYLANSRTTVRSDADVAYQSSLAVGVLGLDLAKAAQRALHSAIAADEPRGWDHQVSAGGEPTARYTLARLGLRRARADAGAGIELKDSLAVSAGYITEVNAALTLRAGRINTPWWSFVPERAEYMTEPAPVYGGGRRPARVLRLGRRQGAGAAVQRLPAGQFRDSELTYDFGDTRPLMGELWAGVTREVGAGLRASWVLRYQSSELESEPGDRDLFWGGVSLSRSL